MDARTDQKLDMSLDDLVAGSSSNGRKRDYSSVENNTSGKADGSNTVAGSVGAADNGVLVAKRIYVGNLSWRTSWQGLKDHFRMVGNGKFGIKLSSLNKSLVYSY